MHCKWMTNDMKPLNEFIHWGNTLKMDFTEKEFRSYRTAVMNWLSAKGIGYTWATASLPQ